MNASDERGISAVRDKVKSFASQTVGSSKQTISTSTDAINGTTSKTYPNPPYKIIILDEADTMTPDAQSALRRVIEAYSKVTRFVLICNYVTRIIQPLGSRCAKFRFKPLSSPTIIARLTDIANVENCKFQDEASCMEKIVSLSGGDMRRAVTMLQCAHSLRPAGGAISTADVEEMSGQIPDVLAVKFVGSLAEKGATFKSVQAALDDLLAEGFPGISVLAALHKFVLSPICGLSDASKAQISLRLAHCDKALVDGGDERIQLLDVAGLVFECCKKK